ncbi:MAG: hypothetical protein D6694_09110 [Gammaproteobacteria bacterium]|nr:MAG: hypothetical protein D6694_09110 [Gammaproteobacteria bacterium]
MDREEIRHRPVNPMLGSQPKFGPVPAEHLIPWFVISFSIFFLCNQILQLDWIWTILMIFWGCSTWWILTGSRPWRFLSKFVSTPNWSRGRVRYQSIFDYARRDRVSHNREQVKRKARRTRLTSD